MVEDLARSNLKKQKCVGGLKLWLLQLHLNCSKPLNYALAYLASTQKLLTVLSRYNGSAFALSSWLVCLSLSASVLNYMNAYSCR